MGWQQSSKCRASKPPFAILQEIATVILQEDCKIQSPVIYNREQVAQVHSRDVCLSQFSFSKQRVVAPREHLFYSSHSRLIQGSLGLGAFLVTPNSRTCQRDTLYGSCHGTEERNARITSLEKQLQVCIGFCLAFFSELPSSPDYFSKQKCWVIL